MRCGISSGKGRINSDGDRNSGIDLVPIKAHERQWEQYVASAGNVIPESAHPVPGIHRLECWLNFGYGRPCEIQNWLQHSLQHVRKHDQVTASSGSHNFPVLDHVWQASRSNSNRSKCVDSCRRHLSNQRLFSAKIMAQEIMNIIRWLFCTILAWSWCSIDLFLLQHTQFCQRCNHNRCITNGTVEQRDEQGMYEWNEYRGERHFAFQTGRD